MGKRLIVILALAFVLGISLSAYAEVQNVKVSGDLNVMGVGRDNFDLGKPFVSGGAAVPTTDYDDKEASLLSITRVRIDADLTDNVSTTVRLLNERNWNGEGRALGGPNTNIGGAAAYGGTGGILTPAAAADNGLGLANAADENEITLDLAYVTLKEFLYSPLSLTVGRQELRFGTALVIGDPDTNIWSSRTNLAQGDLSARKSFDAVRATLDYDPLVVDLVYAKIEEANVALNDDVTLTGLNAAYELDKATTLEGFFFSKVKGSNSAPVYNVVTATATNFDSDTTAAGVTTVADLDRIKDHSDRVNTVGARIVNKSVKNLMVDLQGAFQFGRYNPKFDPNAYADIADQSVKDRITSDRAAWALEVSATYDLKDIAKIAKYSPMITAMYQYLSGDSDNKMDDKTHHAWDPMFEDQTNGHIMNAIFANTNHHLVGVKTSAKLTDDIGLKFDWFAGWWAKRYSDVNGTGDNLPANGAGRAALGRAVVLSGVPGAAASARQFVMGKDSFMGNEFDVTLTYDYTEDVQFNLLGGMFFPGKSINDSSNGNIPASTFNFLPQQAAALELIGSMKVTF